MKQVKTRQDWGVLPYNSGRINGKYLVSNLLGNWDFLTSEEFKTLEQFKVKEDSSLFKRLHDKGLIIKDDNFPRSVTEFRRLQSHLFSDTSLHIAVVTTRCNFSCSYCQTHMKKPQDMDYNVATQLIKYLFDVRSQDVVLEFQGGEPLLNWDVLKFIIEHARKFNATNKNINISMVTNGLLLDEKKINFLIANDVSICISLDGPQNIHDRNRITNKHGGTYKQAAKAIAGLKNIYKQRKLNKPINLLPTITKYSLPFAEKIIDEYVKWGSEVIAVRPINKIGQAQESWEQIGYSPEEFNHFWAHAMDYILSLNKKGMKIRERMASVMLKKILRKENPGYVDLISPCGAGRSTLAYMPNGDIYPCDEARMAGDEMFKLGNVLKDAYEEVMKSTNLFCVCESSLAELWDYNSPYLPWMGTCPVLNYISQNNIVPKISQTGLYKIFHFQFEYIFKKILESKSNKAIFEGWAKEA